MTGPFDIDCPTCKAYPGRFCEGRGEVPHEARAELAARRNATPELFKLVDFRIVGPGGISIAAPDGIAVVSADMLNRIFAIAREARALGDDEGTKIVAQHKRETARIEAAKADLIEQLGLERRDPDDVLAHEEALRRAARAPTRGEDEE